MKAWMIRLWWLSMGGLLVFGWTDFDMPWWVTATLFVATIAWLALGIWWVKRGER